MYFIKIVVFNLKSNRTNRILLGILFNTGDIFLTQEVLQVCKSLWDTQYFHIIRYSNINKYE